VPELPGARIRRLAPLVGFARAAELVSTGNERKAELLAAEGVEWRAAANVTMNRGDFLPENAAALAAIVRANVTRDALERAFARAATAQISAEEYLAQTVVGDPAALAPVIEAVLVENAGQAETYRAGKDGVLRFLIGQVMGRTGGRADPKVVSRLLRDRLGR
jgi:aspartyl-tRNA(Asn)/glutamyl-tRNA(Gln) amidotransferase subunit B